MKLLEYQAKEIFAKYDIPVSAGTVFTDKADAAGQISAAGLSYPVALKAQVPVGGRGKAGGVRFAENAAEAQAITDDLLHGELKGFPVNALLCTEKLSFSTEWYLSILLDRDRKCPLLIFSTEGGVDIETTAKECPEKVIQLAVDPVLGITPETGRYLCSRTGAGLQYAEQLQEMLEKIYRVFMDYGCMLVEINPLAVDLNGRLVALDGKVENDDSANYRLPDMQIWKEEQACSPLVREAASYRFLYIPVEEGGTVAVMSNGSGMLMSCIDLLAKRGRPSAAGLDLGGGATAERIQEAVRITLSTPGVEVLFVCIFGGITRCDEVAQGVANAIRAGAASGGKRVVVRMEGTNKDRGIEILSGVPGATYAGSLLEGIAEIVEGSRVQ